MDDADQNIYWKMATQLSVTPMQMVRKKVRAVTWTQDGVEIQTTAVNAQIVQIMHQVNDIIK